MLISDKIGFKAEAVKKDKEGQYINIIINGQYKDRILHLSTCMCVICVRACSFVSDAATTWTVVHWAPLSMEFSSHEYWSG